MPNRSPRANAPDVAGNVALRALAVNGIWLMLPVLAINLFFGTALPQVYQPQTFWRDIPAWLGLTENVSRVAVTILPLAMHMRWQAGRQRAGLWLYGVGLVAYGLAWVAIIHWPASAWSASLVGFSAPAWLPAIWLAGIVLATEPYRRWVKPALVVAAVVFVASHLAHTILVFARAGQAFP